MNSEEKGVALTTPKHNDLQKVYQSSETFGKKVELSTISTGDYVYLRSAPMNYPASFVGRFLVKKVSGNLVTLVPIDLAGFGITNLVDSQIKDWDLVYINNEFGILTEADFKLHLQNLKTALELSASEEGGSI